MPWTLLPSTYLLFVFSRFAGAGVPIRSTRSRSENFNNQQYNVIAYIMLTHPLISCAIAIRHPPTVTEKHEPKLLSQCHTAALMKGVGCFVCKLQMKLYGIYMSMSNEHSSDAKLISNTFMEQRSLALMPVACYSFRARTTYFSILVATSNSEFILYIRRTRPHSPRRFASRTRIFQMKAHWWNDFHQL